jgi:UTP--glucose-1-phosphate uridylyltransferase
VSFAYQDEALGLGHAVGCGRDGVGDEPFAVLLPDEIMGDSSLLSQMCDVSAATGGSVVGLKHVPLAR